MKRDKPWRPADYPAPEIYIVPPPEDLHDPDLTDAQADKVDVVLVVAFAIGVGAIVVFAASVFVIRMLTLGR